MTAFYNEIDPYAAQWLRNLITAGLIAPGVVDERDIRDIQPSDLDGFTQCHFFAGIGGWSRALRLAGWSDDRPVWTGSCPCQPFSVAGFQQGFDDPRHLWPQFRRLISERSPAVVFGEQVAGASAWLSLVRSDLEKMGYAMGAIPLEAASADAEHYRDRYWFVADRESERGYGLEDPAQPSGGGGAQDAGHLHVANDDGERSQEPVSQPGDIGAERTPVARDSLCDVVNTEGVGWGEGWTESEFRSRGFTAAVASLDGCQYLECPDGKFRRLPPPRVRWLGNGIPSRVAKLRAFGNAIDPRPAVKFISAYLDC
jgi:DNA (cytosine-5)-methyltransferase 1